MEETRPEVGGEAVPQGLEDPGLPAVEGLSAGNNGSVGLEPGVVHGEEHDRQQGGHHHRHHALQIESVPHMGGPGRDRIRGKENRIDSLEERIQMIEFTARLESFFLYVEEPAEESHHPSFQIS